MKLKKLLRELDKFDDLEAEVFLSSDEEGNSFGRIFDITYEKLEEVSGKSIILWPTSL